MSPLNLRWPEAPRYPARSVGGIVSNLEQTQNTNVSGGLPAGQAHLAPAAFPVIPPLALPVPCEPAQPSLPRGLCPPALPLQCPLAFRGICTLEDAAVTALPGTSPSPVTPLITGRAPRVPGHGAFPAHLLPAHSPTRRLASWSQGPRLFMVSSSTHTPVKPRTPRDSARAPTGPGTWRCSVNIGGRRTCRLLPVCAPTQRPLLPCSPPMRIEGALRQL